MKFRVYFLLAIFCITVFAARAVQMEALSIEELSRKAEVILQGKVDSLTTSKDDQGRIFTRALIQVQEVWKGTLTTNVFSVVLAGGLLGEEKSIVPGQAEYSVGEEVVAFLRLNHEGEGVTLGLVQGKFKVYTDAKSGKKTVQSRFHGKPSSSGVNLEKSKSTLSAVFLSDDLTLDLLKQKVFAGKDSK